MNFQFQDLELSVLLHTKILSLILLFDTGSMLENLYGKHAAALYAQAADFNKTARFYYMKAEDAYYLANAQASYDDWRRARRQWDYFYRYGFHFFCTSFTSHSLFAFAQPEVNTSSLLERSSWES